MKAITFHGPLKVQVSEVEDPKIQAPTDVILKVTTAAICGSDMHLYEGRMPLPGTGWIIGHEYIGEVVEVGSAVTNFKPGDRAVGAFVASCGDCFFCHSGWPTQCAKQQTFGFMTLAGSQAEYVRVPFGHFTLDKVPDGVPDDKGLFAGDILSTGYFCAERGEIKPGDVVAVVGSGPVGLFVQMCALRFEPKVVLAIDSLPHRLEMSRRLGAVPVDMSNGDPTAAVREHTEGRGADVVLEAVGIAESLKDAFRYVRGGGTISAVGMYSEPEFPFPMFVSFLRDLTFRIGICPAKRYMAKMLGMIQEGKIDPSFVVTHTLPLAEAPRGYEMFHNRAENCLKILLKP